MRHRGWLERASRALAREWRRPGERPPARPLPRHGELRTDGDVLRALTRLRGASGWERLEIGQRPDDGLVYGHCLPPSGKPFEFSDGPVGPGSPEVILRLRELFLACGWQRLEAVSDLRGGTGGFCERADGSGVSYPGRHEREVARVTSIDHPGVIHVATGPVRWEDPGDGCQ